MSFIMKDRNVLFCLFFFVPLQHCIYVKRLGHANDLNA